MKKILLIFAFVVATVFNVSAQKIYDSELGLKLKAICDRRGVKLATIESVAFSRRLNFGLANGTALLPAEANTFYYCEKFLGMINVKMVTASPIIRLSNLGGGSAGDVDFLPLLAWDIGQNFLWTWEFETNSMTYIVNGNTAGQMSLVGIVWKVTYK